jgi:hypothetical protein
MNVVVQTGRLRILMAPCTGAVLHRRQGMVKTMSWSVTAPDPGFNDPAAR